MGEEFELTVQVQVLRADLATLTGHCTRCARMVDPVDRPAIVQWVWPSGWVDLLCPAHLQLCSEVAAVNTTLAPRSVTTL